MKVIAISSFLFFCIVMNMNGQKASLKDSIRTAANLKSGNSQDVFISFFQLAINDITGKEKSFKFQSSLFGIKAKTDSTLLRKREFLKQTFNRNFVVSIAPTLDEKYKFKSNTVGLKWAIKNNRDKAIYNYFLPSRSAYEFIRDNSLMEYLKLKNNNVLDKDYDLASTYFYPGDEKPIAFDKLPKDFIPILNKLLSGSVFNKVAPDKFRDTLVNEFAMLAEQLENKGLWTLSSNLSSDNNGKLFSIININTEYLKGIVKKNARSNVELNLTANLDFVDDTTTIASLDLNRKIFSFNGGFNWIIAKNSNGKSLMEFKGSVKYNNILSGKYIGEASNSFTGEGVFRIRITDQIWIPFTVAYDPKNGNLFGFLSVKTNFDAIRNK